MLLDQPDETEDYLDTREFDTLQRVLEAERERLRQRTQLYARPINEIEPLQDDSHSLLTFALGSEQYGVEIELVRGVRQAPRIARIPAAPAFYPGVINARGQIVTVLDLRHFFGLIIPPDAPMPTEVVMAQSGRLRLGLLAHHIHGVESLPNSEVKSVEHLPYAYGVTKDRLIVLNLAQLFEDQRLIVGATE
jgi:chemotaxis signal transduction protein